MVQTNMLPTHPTEPQMKQLELFSLNTSMSAPLSNEVEMPPQVMQNQSCTNVSVDHRQQPETDKPERDPESSCIAADS